MVTTIHGYVTVIVISTLTPMRCDTRCLEHPPCRPAHTEEGAVPAETPCIVCGDAVGAYYRHVECGVHVCCGRCATMRSPRRAWAAASGDDHAVVGGSSGSVA